MLELRRFSLVKPGDGARSVHRPVHRMTRIGLPDKRLGEAAARLVSFPTESTHPDTRPDCRSL